MRKMTGIHVVLGGIGITAMIGCSVKSDGLAVIDAGRSAPEGLGGEGRGEGLGGSGGGGGARATLPLGTGGADVTAGTG